MTPGRYQKKPVVIEAVQVTATNVAAAAEWADGADYWGKGCPTPAVFIKTLEGEMRREPFPTSDRRFYPCKPEIFAATYESEA